MIKHKLFGCTHFADVIINFLCGGEWGAGIIRMEDFDDSGIQK